MRNVLALAAVAAALLLPSSVAATAGGQPVALVVAEASNEVFAVSLGPHGGHVLERLHLDDPLMVAAPLHGPAVVVNPHGSVTLLGWHSLRPLEVLRGFRRPEVAAIAPGGRYAYVSDADSGDVVVIDLQRRSIVRRLFVGHLAHHLDFSPDGHRLWVALGETATTIVRLDTSNLGRPRVVGRIHPRVTAHGIAFSGKRALVTSGYGSSLEAVSWRTYGRHGSVPMPYGSFNLATFGGNVVTSSVLTGYVTELEAGTLKRMWTTKIAPVTRYVAISVWPR